MKPFRFFIFGGLALVVLVLGVVALALNASFQTWAARQALGKRPGLQATLGSLSAGLRHVEVGHLRLESRGAVLVLPTLEADLPLVTAVWGKNIQLGRLVARGWTLDLTQEENSKVTPQNTAAAVAVGPIFQGIFSSFQFPVDMAVEEVDLTGEIIFPSSPDRPSTRLNVAIHGGGLGVGRAGRFIVDLTGAADDGGVFKLHSEFVAMMDTPRSFGRLSVATDAVVSGRRFPQDVTLTAKLAAERVASGETLHLALAGAGKELADVQAEFLTAGARVVGRWKLNLSDTDLTPFALGRELPVFSATGEGGFETDATFAEIHATGRLDASADKLSVIRSELSAVGAVKISADFDVFQHAYSVRVERLNVAVSGVKPVFTVHALQSFEFNARTGGLSVADPAQDLLWFSLQGVPLAWARPFLGTLALNGDDLRGEFAASARNGGLTLRSKSPLAITQLRVSQAGKPLLNAVALAASISADYAPQGWQVSVPDFTARSGGTTLVACDLKAGRLSSADQPMKITGHWSANLPAVMLQPVAAGPVRLTEGTAQGELAASIGPGAQQYLLSAVLANMVAAQKEALPTVTANLRADIDRNGKITFNAPLVFERLGRKSDLSVAGTLTRGPSALALDAQITGESIIVEDVQLLAAPFASPASNTPNGPPLAAAGSDAVPFWRGVNGQIALAIKKAVYGQQFQVSDVAGVIRVGEGALRFEGVRAGFGADSDLKLNAGVTFTAASIDPYVLTADLAVLNLDAAPAFRALDPTRLPTIEGRLNLSSRIAGEGKNIGDLAGRAHGDLQVSGKSGLFRALRADVSDRIQKSQSAVATLGSLFGKKDLTDYANKAQILSDIAKVLSEIPYDQFSMTASRNPTLNIILKDFTLISPEIRLNGTGQVSHAAGVPLLNQTLALELNLAVRGHLGDLMQRAGLLNSARDDLGYTAFISPIKISGTAAKPDTSELQLALINSALARSSLLNSLLGK